MFIKQEFLVKGDGLGEEGNPFLQKGVSLIPQSIAKAVSGGADSLYAMLLLKELGHRVTALHGRFLSNAPECPPGLPETCRKLGVELRVLDLRAEFHSLVIQPFIKSYLAGETPNPCVRCNAAIKFGLLLDAAMEMGTQCLATGHYAALVAHEHYGRALRSAADKSKDQSYCLAMLPRERLERAVFPLSSMNKTDILADLQKRGMAAPISAESQDICFVPGNDYRALVADRGAPSPPGPIFLLEDGARKEIARHKGLWQYTEGQRRGLNIAHSEPLYVIGKDIVANALLVGPKEAVFRRECRATQLNYLAPFELWPEKIYARIRYRQKSSLATVIEVSQDEISFAFAEPQMLSAPGQAAVFYDENGCVLGGAILV